MTTADGWVMYDAKGPDDDNIYALWIPDDGREIEGDEFTVEATLEIIRHPASHHLARTQYRLVAVRQEKRQKEEDEEPGTEQG